MFNVILNWINIDTPYAKSFINGILEVTNGIKDIASIANNCIILSPPYIKAITITAFLLGFGGLSVLMQTASIIADSGISLKPYFIGKILHGSISALYTFLLLKYTSIISSEYIPAFSYGNNVSHNVTIQSSNMFACICLIILVGIAISIIKRLIHTKKYHI